MAKSSGPDGLPYLNLLRMIAIGESVTGRYMSAWADVTPDAELASTLRLVAERETSHAEVFWRRIKELGADSHYAPNQKDFVRMAMVANPAISDLEKVGPDIHKPDPLADISSWISGGELDPLTSSLMIWFVAEERDTIARLAAAYAAVRAKAASAVQV
jgi:hypothetical protein